MPDFLKHLFNKHDGEARLFGPAGWVPLEEDVRQPRFWSYQFARTYLTRGWLWERPSSAWLTWEDVHWVLDENDDRTLLIRRVRAATGAPHYFIRSGIFTTLPDVMFHGLEQECTAYEAYKLYMDLPIFVHRRTKPTRKAPRWR